jgi:NADH-quinone oxidoreductase subunit J
MSVTTGLFYLFSAILLAAAFRVITTRNPVHAVLYLVLTFFQASMIWMLLKAEFLSLTLVLVYVGAVMVLFLFVVMMLDVNMEEMRIGFWKHFPLAALLGILIIAEMSVVLMGGFQLADVSGTLDAAVKTTPQLSNSKALGQLLYTQYIYPLEVATAILLVGMIAAIALTLRQRKDSKAMDPAAQVRVTAKDRMIVVKLEATRPALPIDIPGDTPSVESKA